MINVLEVGIPIRELCGEAAETLCICPSCGQFFNEPVPVEFLEDVDTWQKDGCQVVFCEDCRQWKTR